MSNIVIYFLIDVNTKIYYEVIILKADELSILISARIKELSAQRRQKQPLEFPSAGSYFKRPEGHFAGKLIEDCGRLNVPGRPILYRTTPDFLRTFGLSTLEELPPIEKISFGEPIEIPEQTPEAT